MRMNWIDLLSKKRVGEKPGKDARLRSTFEQDYDRIIFSSSFRSLQDKTQVFPLAGKEFAHTRLTHSLEVSSVGRSLGRQVGEIVLQDNQALQKEGVTSYDFGTITATASLAHDIGNPPFGHAGEAGISEYFSQFEHKNVFDNELSEKEWSDICTFEGNAQGFRILNKNFKQGLRLTNATLGAFTKYPCESLLVNRDSSRKSQKKYGVHQGNMAAFEEMAKDTGLISLSNREKVWCRHPLSFLVEAADDICYSIIDLEDGANLGWISYKETEYLLSQIIGDKFMPEKMNRLNGITEKTGMLRALTIFELVSQTVNAFINHEKEILSGTFDRALTSIIPGADALKNIQRVSVEKIYRSRHVLEREATGFEVLHGLLDAFMPGIIGLFKNEKLTWREQCLHRLLPEETQQELNVSNGLYEKTLCLLDFISGLTDSRALSLFRNIKGIAIPGGL